MMTRSLKMRWLLNGAVMLCMLIAILLVGISPARAASELFFSEYIEGTSNNKALEIYNGTGAAINLATGGYNVQMYFNGNPVSTLTINLAGTVADGDVFVLAQSSANATILAQADQTNGSGWFNGDDAVVLRKGTTIIDVIGQFGFDPGTEWGTGLTTTADNTLRRKGAIEAGDTNGSDAFDPSIEWDGYATDAFDGLGSHTVTPPAPKINEFSASTVGTDVEYFEIFGAPNADYSAYTALEIEGDGSGSGVVDEIIALGMTDASGLYLANLPANALENGSLTLLLVKNFTGALNSDLDTNNDGTFDLTPWDAIVDAVAVNDGTAGDLLYGVPALGPNYDGVSSFAPGGASRIPDGFDTDAASDWVRNDFDLAGIPGFVGTLDLGEAYNTPGATNEVIVPPQAQLVINEVDYDQPGTDTAEFVEVKNAGLGNANLSEYTLELVNGTGGGAAVYDTIALPAVNLAPGDYFVVCANAATVANCDLDDAPDTNFIQNGAPDAVGLRHNGVIVDAVSYEGDSGTPYTEGSGTGLDDNGSNASESIARCPDGTDTNQNNIDLSLRPATPGAINSCVLDELPVVVSTNPLNGAPDASISTNITVNFSENVTVSGSWFDITCSISGAHPAIATSGPQNYILDPDTNFVNGDSCTVTIFAPNVTDQDGTPHTMAADYSFSFSAIDVCVLTYTPIYNIQGSGLAAAITGVVTTQGVVIGDNEGASPALRGFYMQDVTGDSDPATSDGIFVFNGNNDSVNLGDVVRVTGTAAEFQDQTQISASSIVNCGTGSVTPVDVTFPVPSATYLEQYEGMLVRLPQTMYVTEHFQLGRFGQVVMSANARLQQPTNVVPPGAPAIALQASNNLNRIIVDDASQAQNPDPILFGRGGNQLTASNTLRGGDTATGIVGVLTYTWSGNSASGNAYRVRPIFALGGGVPNFQPANPRPSSAPEVGGTVKVVGMNLLNYFNTFDGIPDVVDNCRNGVGGAATDCRGADTQTEFDRQVPKTVAAILKLNPDVIGVNEIENDGYGPDSALQHLVDQLNADTAPGTYAFIDVDANTGLVNAMGTDAIKVGIIYKPAVVSPIGQTAVLNSVAFVNGGDSAPRNRPTVAQAFQVNANEAVFIVDVNHLKSKGSACDLADQGDGQGNCNTVRLNAVNELMTWLASDPTGTGDPDILLIGDYNSYAMEDPITAIKNAGYTSLVETFLGPDAYSYVFDGQWGYLDNALGSASIFSQVTGVGDYHINADEPSVLDYNTDFKTTNLQNILYAPDEFRVSDHDPVIIGLNPDGPPAVTVDPASQTVQYSDPVAGATIAASDSSADIPLLSIITQWNVDGGAFTDGLPTWLTLSDRACDSSSCTWTLSGTALTAPGTYVVRVNVSDTDDGSTETDITFVVVQEDARVTYTGALFASTASPTSSIAEVTLAATVQDISVTADANGDVAPGDIRNATVTFVDRDNSNAVLCTAAVGLVDPADLQTGTATCTWTVDLGSLNSISTNVGIVVGGYYLRDSTVDDTVVTVSKALTNQFITGGGYLVLGDSAGQIAGDDGSKANFGFNVKYNKGGKNLSGKVTILVRRLEADGVVHVYQIKSNAITSLSVNVDEGTAVFNGKANITDVTDPLNPISIAGNATLQITMDDNGEPGSGDTIGITLWKKDGGLWFASKWDGTQTIPQILDGGNLVVH